jgi:transglutaminase-like putative cysteine protease
VALTDLRPGSQPQPPMTLSAPRTPPTTPPTRGWQPDAPSIPQAWPRMLLLTATLIVSLAGLNVALSHSSWWIVGSLFIALTMVTTTLVRQLTRPVWLPTVAGAVVTLLGLTVGFASDTALLGIIPTPDTVARFVKLNGDAWDQIAEQPLPASPEPSIVFLLAGSVAVLALFGDIALQIAPALTALPILTLLVVPVAVHADLAEPFWFVAAAAGYLLLLRIGRRRASGRSVILLGALVVIGSFVLANVFPPVTQSADDAGGIGVATGINPLINLGQDLRRGAPVTAVTYTTSNDQAAYLRLATLDDFDGRSWSPTLVPPAANQKLSEFPAPVGLTNSIKQSKVSATVDVGGIQGSWLPVPYPTTRVTGTSGDWFWEPQGLSVRSPDTNVGGQKYTASFLAVQPDLAQLRASTVDAAAVKQYLELPPQLPKIITDTAEQVAGSAGTEYDQAVALQNYFQSDLFTYSTTAPVKQGYDGTGTDVVAKFLQVKAGYCVHFASAMAIMARVLGIPSRVAVGFQPGSPTTVGDTTAFTVSTHDLHAWPELYFAGIGWLRFEPTPGRGSLPDYSVPAAVDQLPSDTATSAATSAPTSDATAPAQSGKRLPTDGPGASTASTAGGGVSVGWLATLVLLAILLAAAAVPVVTRAVIRLRRQRAISRGRDPAANAWAEVRDTARDYGWIAPQTETARSFAARLSLVLAEDSASITAFSGQVESLAYGRPDAAPLDLGALRSFRRAIAASASPRERFRAVFLPSSLLARVRFDPDA